MSLFVIIFALLTVLLPAVFAGLLSLGFYYVLAKAQPVIGRLAPIAFGLLLVVLVPVLSFVPSIRPIIPVLDLVIILMGVLTLFMPLRNRLPERQHFTILFSGSVVTVALLLVYGFAMAFGGGGRDPVTQFLMSLPLPEVGLPIMSLILAYLAAVLISAVIFGIVLAVVTAFRRRVVWSG